MYIKHYTHNTTIIKGRWCARGVNSAVEQAFLRTSNRLLFGFSSTPRNLLREATIGNSDVWIRSSLVRLNWTSSTFILRMSVWCLLNQISAVVVVFWLTVLVDFHYNALPYLRGAAMAGLKFEISFVWPLHLDLYHNSFS